LHDCTPHERARRLVADAEAQFAAINDQLGDRGLGPTAARLLYSLRRGRVVTGWSGASYFPEIDGLVVRVRELAQENPALIAGEIRGCDPLVARWLIGRPTTLEDFRILARCTSSARAPWVAGLLLDACLRPLLLRHPNVVEVGGPAPVSREDVADLILDAIQRLAFDAGLQVGLDLVASGFQGARLLELCCGERFDEVYLTACRLVARHPNGAERLQQRLCDYTPNEPPLALSIVSSYIDDTTADRLRRAFLDQMSRFFEDNERLAIFHAGATPLGRLLAKALVHAVMKDLSSGSGWWSSRWARHASTFESWPDRRSPRDHDRLLTLFATAMAACRAMAFEDRTRAIEVLGHVLDNAAAHVRDLLLGVEKRDVSTRVSVQLIVHGLAFGSELENPPTELAPTTADFVECLRTSELARDALAAADAVGYDAIRPGLERARASLVTYENALATVTDSRHVPPRP
jgi:hypothetical protein